MGRASGTVLYVCKLTVSYCNSISTAVLFGKFLFGKFMHLKSNIYL
jgi:hypothetical protein